MPEKKTGLRRRRPFEEGSYLSGRVSPRFFYLDNRGSHISQKLGAITGLLVRQIEDSDPMQKVFLFISTFHVDSSKPGSTHCRRSCGGQPEHPSLEDRIFNPEQVRNTCLFHPIPLFVGPLEYLFCSVIPLPFVQRHRPV